MSTSFVSTGRLRYSPKTLGKYQDQKWWLIIDCDPNLGAYYRYLYKLHNYHLKSLTKPAWAEHITVVRNEEPLNAVAWEKYDGQEIEFQFTPVAETDGHYTWFPVACDRALDMREELGLSRHPEFPLHLSIGHSGVTIKESWSQI